MDIDEEEKDDLEPYTCKECGKTFKIARKTAEIHEEYCGRETLDLELPKAKRPDPYSGVGKVI